MSSCIESYHLLTDSPNERTPQRHEGCQPTISTDEGQSDLEVILEIPTESRLEDNTSQTAVNELGNDDEQEPHPSWFSSYKPLKYLSIVFGLWSGRWTLCLIYIPLAIAILPLDIFAPNFFSCDVSFSTTTKKPVFRATGSFDYEYRSIIFTAEIITYFTMIYCIHRPSRHPMSLRLVQAFSLAKPTKLVNVILLVSFILIITAVLPQLFWPSKGTDNRGCSYKTTVHNLWLQMAWLLFTSFTFCQGVVSCLVFDTVMKALIALNKDCIEKIITLQADSVDHYVQIHQKFCFKIESTFADLRNWLLVNTLSYIVFIVYLLIETAIVLSRGLLVRDEYLLLYCYGLLWSDCEPIINFGVTQYYFRLALFLYASFVCYFPWHSLANLRRSFTDINQKLNSKTNWSQQHLFRNRQHLNNFTQYARITECCSFMQFSFSSKIPYISVLLAVCGLMLTVYKQFSPLKNNQKLNWTTLDV